jgi:HSP20 family protein
MRLVRYSYPSYRSLSPISGGFSRPAWPGLESEIDRLFASALADFGAPAAGARFPVDLYEDKANTYVRAELPGVSREDIQVETVDGTLTITATRKEKDGDQEQTITFNRAIALSAEVQSDQITAAYENGVLTVTLPKKEEAKPRKITIGVN